MIYLFFSLGLVAPLPASAITLPDSVKTPRRIDYQDKDHARLPSAEGAAFRVETTVTDSLYSTERTYYVPSGKLCSARSLLNQQPQMLHGAHVKYYESGQLLLQESYVQGKAQGQRLTYYPSGVLRRREQIVPDQPITGECFDATGQVVPYFPYEVAPAYPGGQVGLLQDLAMRIQYPAEALRDGVEGVVLVKFLVSKTGQIGDIQPASSLAKKSRHQRRIYGYLQEAAMQAVQKLQPFSPGQLEGEPEAVYITVPLTFRIR